MHTDEAKWITVNLRAPGYPREIYSRPVNRFVATFVGSPAMNFLLGRITQHSGGEHIILTSESGGAHEVTAELTEPMGSDLLARTGLRDHPTSVRPRAETRLSPGDCLRVLLPQHRLNLFDATTGARL